MKRNEVDRSKLSPGMKQYMEIKDQYQEELLFYRLGDFYELFFEDGILCSRELELTLTSKNGGLEERIPMCGVPFHSVQPYIEKLVSKGYKIAICEQLEDPKTAKGMVKRGVVQVISKGTVVDYEMLKDYDNNYIGSILDFTNLYTITYGDISTGSLYIMEIPKSQEKLVNTILSLNLKEVILYDNSNQDLINLLKYTYNIEVSISSEYLENKYEYLYKDIKEMRHILGIKHLSYYLVVKQLKELDHITGVEIVRPDEYLEMDVHTIRNLELFETLRLKERTYSLIWLLDKTKTAMGSRCLKNWLANPLKEKELILKRYDMIDTLRNEFITKEELIHDLDEVYDLERLCGKVICGNLNARDVLQIKRSLSVLPSISSKIKTLGFPYVFEDETKLYELLERSIYETPPIGLKEGYLIKDGYNSELDELKSIRSGGKDFIASLEEQERERTGIKNLKVGYTKVFGYYIEISKGQCDLVKDEYGYERRQTLTNCERFISPLLKEKEALVLNAEEKIIELEYNLFLEIKEEIKKEIFNLKAIARDLASIDAIISLATCADEYNLVRPELLDTRRIEIVDGRHPVVERVSKKEYVSNDCMMGEDINTLLITGPNMSGKSTFMRQLAIIIIMAQMGSFVPAASAKLPIFDKIFTRIGASDDLVSGESTFMVEMMEARNALSNATSNSLILFDELGRGTSTYDGMSLAQSILEYVNDKIKCKTLFSTHYHELTKLDELTGIKNIHVEAYEKDGNVTFLHKVKDGAIEKSYGINVAKLAGMPNDLLKRASEILKYYESNNKETTITTSEQVTFNFDEPSESNLVLERLEEIDPLKITPIDAINLLYELKELSKK
ncbi:MAG TPA: DNA mismatch repair protein MutS [Firmicutes bacterium]|nr:DNA mismatch repair protein MutS [Bacillota bacterium]